MYKTRINGLWLFEQLKQKKKQHIFESIMPINLIRTLLYTSKITFKNIEMAIKKKWYTQTAKAIH